MKKRPPNGARKNMTPTQILDRNGVVLAENGEFTDPGMAAIKARLDEMVAAGSIRRVDRSAINVHGEPDSTDAARIGIDRDVALANINRVHSASVLATFALQRIAEGTYGMCLACEELVLAKRLIAVPHALFCMPCQERFENGDAIPPEDLLPLAQHAGIRVSEEAMTATA